MEIECDSLDGVLWRLYKAVKADGRPHDGGTRGASQEMLGVSIRILKPRARISRSENRGKPFSAMGELLWYLSGSDRLDFIENYVPEYRKDAVMGILEGAYGPRLTAMRGTVNQLDSVFNLLSSKPGSRRAVIQLFNAEDITTEHKEIPCTTTMQFHLRDGLLHMSVTMRSNDAYWGLPHDVFCFTMLQEMMACRLGVELGEYYQYVGSMHVYEKYLSGIDEYIAEGFQQTSEMPQMPAGDPFAIVGRLLAIEAKLRAGQDVEAGTEAGDPYWADLIRLLQVFWVREAGGDRTERLEQLRAKFVAPCYKPYVDGRLHMARLAADKATDASANAGAADVA